MRILKSLTLDVLMGEREIKNNWKIGVMKCRSVKEC